ncbi:MAG: hypothetical protein H6Q35_96 [Proteobacteria bacterium]|nr:hypothetical protein [Pseudomonadota bacterium]
MENFTNYLTIYGALVFTIIALIVNILRYKHTLKQNDVKLKISYKKLEILEEDIKDLGKPFDPLTQECGPSYAKICEVTVQNIGNVNAYIKDISMINEDEQKANIVLSDIPEVRRKPIEPKASKTFDMNITNKEDICEIKYVIVIDQTDKEWKKKI